ncbi:type I glyceraldehyde-3-phosphate dehydrogenase [soil metagenome]
MSRKLGINGFGRIGRLCLRAILQRNGDGTLSDFEIVGVNDLTDAATLAHLFKYDSVHGVWPGEVRADGDHLVIDGNRFRVHSERDPANLPWGDLGAEVIIESTGFFTERSKAAAHLEAGASKVVISAPATGDLPTVVLGVNDADLEANADIISNASCTTNCLAPMVKVLDDAFGVQQGFMTTVHAYTADQRLQDAPHKDLRRARAAALSIIPTTTGAAKAVGLVLPHLKGKLDGFALRVPVPDGSLTDLTAWLDKDISAEDINAAFKEAAHGDMKGILQYSEEPLVSTDIVRNPHSCIVDSLSTMAQGRMAKVVGWYDNEWGYANRTVELASRLLD